MIKRLRERWADPWDPICYDIIIGILCFKIVLILGGAIFFTVMNLMYGWPIPNNFPPRGF